MMTTQPVVGAVQDAVDLLARLDDRFRGLLGDAANSRSTCDGGMSSLISLMRTSSVLYCMILQTSEIKELYRRPASCTSESRNRFCTNE